MVKTFIISDTHFYHHNIIKYCNRPFHGENHMNEVMIENWNSVVSPKDRVIHVGDFCFGDQFKAELILNRLQGNILLCRGNHDKKLWKWYLGHGHEQKCRVLPVESTCVDSGIGPIWISHYPEDVRNGAPLNTIKFKHVMGHIHGHIHDRITKDPTKFNACVEYLNYTPIELEAVINTLCGSFNRSSDSISPKESIQTNQKEFLGVVS